MYINRTDYVKEATGCDKKSQAVAFYIILSMVFCDNINEI